jgi:EAL domain-containing protein (putative c-di-GMP-specific phosphodiesterase class I)
MDRYPDRAPHVVYLNFSALELADIHLPRVLARALQRYSLKASHVGIEIVEDNFIDPDIARRLCNLRDRGHPLSIDDFGTGYSSLSRLVDLPVDLVKIDRSFIAGIPDDTRRVGVIDAIVNIANALNIQIVAEGVETPAQQHHLTTAGAHLLQGYLTGRPQPAGEIDQLLTALPVPRVARIPRSARPDAQLSGQNVRAPRSGAARRPPRQAMMR